MVLGAGQRRANGRPILISDDDAWVDGYRGLFGLDTHDRFGGERSPAGPKYTRSGEQRLSWYDPLGFGGPGQGRPAVPVAADARRARSAGARRSRRGRRADQGADRHAARPVARGPGAGRRRRHGGHLPRRARRRSRPASSSCASSALSEPRLTTSSVRSTASEPESSAATWAIRART